MSAHNITALTLLIISLVIPSTLLYALADADKPQIVTSQFRLFTDFDDNEALELAARISQLHAFYNQFFNFNVFTQERLTVRYFSTKHTFDSYLNRLVGRTYQNFVFLDYDDPQKNELLIYPRLEGFDTELARFSFLQFLENHVPTAPLWLREGYSLYFENSIPNREQTAVIFRENRNWLAALKEIIVEERLIDFERFFTMDATEVEQNREIFYPQAWGMVSFLVSYRERGSDRLIYELNSILDPQAPEQENIVSTMRVLRGHIDFDLFEVDFRTYILNKESFDGLITAAVDHYNADRLDDAEQVLHDAIALDDSDPVPHYYLGLINYDRRDHESADRYYIQALTRGGSEGLIYYALGVNALLDRDRSRALNYFAQARTSDPTLSEQIGAVLRQSY